ncbi:MAG: hypothetical protein ABUJ92_12845 [Desulfobacterales bacterium]
MLLVIPRNVEAQVILIRGYKYQSIIFLGVNKSEASHPKGQGFCLTAVLRGGEQTGHHAIIVGYSGLPRITK